LPFGDAIYDLVLATDIVEHVDDDALALREIARVLRPGGVALLTVPAFQSLWGLQDKVSHHKRRYRLTNLLDRVLGADLTPLRAYYFNYLLFMPIWLARQVIALLDIPLKSENQVNSALLNRVLTAIFGLDVRTAGLVRPPFGVSALVIARKKL
jgi:SAM-dependent methyltransferase